LYERARRVMPGGNTRTTIFVRPHPLYAVDGCGCRIRGADGAEWVDFLNNYTSLIHGHAHPAIVAAARAALERGTAFSMPTEAEVRLAETIVSRLPAGFQIRFCNSGTEAVMMGVKAARAYTGRSAIAKFEGAYHGAYDYVEVSEELRPDEWGSPLAPHAVPLSKGTPEAVLDDVLVLPFNDTQACVRLIEEHASRLACVVVDPLPNRVGLIPARSDSLAAIRDVTRAHGILLFADLVISFRLGYHSGVATAGVEPDLVALGKIIGGGFAVGAIAARNGVMGVFDPWQGPAVYHGGTFNANPVTMAAGQAAMDLLTPEVFDHLNSMGQQLRDRGNSIFQSTGVPGQLSGAGSLFRIHTKSGELVDARSAMMDPDELAAHDRIYQYLTTHGIHIATSLLGCLSTAMTEMEVETFLSVLQGALHEAVAA